MSDVPSRRPAVTLVTTCKPFEGEFAALQEAALGSWARLDEPVEVVVVGDEPGVADACARHGLRHVPAVARSPEGVPLLPDLMAVGESAARAPVVCLVNADIVLLEGLAAATDTVRRRFDRFLLLARRVNVAAVEGPDPDGDWRDGVRARMRGGSLEPAWGGVDLFAWPRGGRPRLPALAMGRTRWDSALILAFRRSGAAVVDATDDVPCMHPEHGYQHHPAGRDGVFDGADARRNRSLTGGPAGWLTALNATHTLRNGRLERRVLRSPAHLLRAAAAAPALHPMLSPLRPLVTMLRPAWTALGRRSAG